MGSYIPWLPHLDHHAFYASYIIHAVYHSPLHLLKGYEPSLARSEEMDMINSCQSIIKNPPVTL